MAELLFEILCEEIPARMQEKAGGDLGRMVGDALKKAGLSVDNLRTFTGPRRLVLVADIPLRSPDIKEERKGPRVGSPEQALAGFMRGAGLTDISQAEIRSDKKGEHYVAVIEKQGRNASDVLAEALPQIMGSFPWPKSMKSGTTNFKWVRPLQSLLCVLGGDVVDFEVNGFKTGNTTRGHRRMAKQDSFTVKDFADYKQKLETEGFVILDAAERKDIILKGATEACAKAGLELVDDKGLLDEVAGLAEWPVVILGDMDPSFLELPGEVIRLSMRTHQKYFAVRDPKTGTLAPNFIVVANQVAPDGGTAIAQGNSRVLSARLADAQFFQSEDAKLNLEDYYDKLDGVIFHQKLGTIKDKSERVAALARQLAPIVGADPDKAERAAKLAKCDLVTNMVVEFTSLQGQIGRLMAEREGIDPDICIAIEDHYKPQGPADRVPTNPVAVAVALADKLDTLMGFWVVDIKPTGSKDPFALRRAGLGLVRIVLKSQKRINLFRYFVPQRREIHRVILLNEIVNIAYDKLTQPERNKRDLKFDKDIAEITEKAQKSTMDLRAISERNDLDIIGLTNALKSQFPMLSDLLSFILDRLKGHLRDQGIKHDTIDAVFALGGDDLVDISNRAEALQAFLSTDDGANLLAGYKRAANILKAEAKKGELPDVVISKGTQAEEEALFDAITRAKPEIETALSKEDYAGAMGALSKLRAPIDAFFDKTMVVSEIKDERENRLALLMEIRKTAKTIADFDKIEG
ncbi:MAG: glycine--tRNA ligase subunit beta [Robiginitomaculum sp.]|nr:MAG: glycine--tRNA ligase subunit beta [Robiginitomaculum sp.]